MVFNTTSIIYLQDYIENVNLLDVDIIGDTSNITTNDQNTANQKTQLFDVLYAFSIDKENYSDFKSKEELSQEVGEIGINQYYVSIKLSKKPTHTDLATTIYQKTNVIQESYPIEIELKYDNIQIEPENIRIIDEDREISNYPLWNLYDNQNVTVKRWIAQCNAMAQMYGHVCVYFRTDASEINKTLLHTHKREVVDVKKIMIMFPSNEIGSPDKIIYNDWDIPLSDDFICHIVWDMFQRAFGEGVIPQEKDYIYLPMLNKMYRIGVVQPINKFMGKIGWFEASLLKYEDDESITISQNAVDDLNNIPEFESLINDITKGSLLELDGDDSVQEHEGDNVIEQTENHVESSLRNTERIEQSTIYEKREATDNYANKLVDSTNYISGRESDKYREFMNKRLNIIQVKPSEELFPISMYDNTEVDNNIVAMQYKLTDFTQTSKSSLTPKTSFSLSFNIVPTKKFGGNIISLLNTSGTTNIFSMEFERSKFPNILFRLDISPMQEKMYLDVDLEINELYNVVVSYNIELKQFVFNIYKLVDTVKKPIYNNIMIINNEISIPTIGYIHLYGGKFLSSDVCLDVDSKQILNDTCQPLLDIGNLEII